MSAMVAIHWTRQTAVRVPLRRGPRGPRTAPPPVGRPFGEALAAFRAECGVSQNRLSHEADLDHSHIGRLERGERGPSRAYVISIGLALGATTDELDDLLVAAGFLPSSQGVRRLAAADLTWDHSGRVTPCE